MRGQTSHVGGALMAFAGIAVAALLTLASASDKTLAHYWHQGWFIALVAFFGVMAILGLWIVLAGAISWLPPRSWSEHHPHAFPPISVPSPLLVPEANPPPKSHYEILSDSLREGQAERDAARMAKTRVELLDACQRFTSWGNGMNGWMKANHPVLYRQLPKAAPFALQGKAEVLKHMDAYLDAVAQIATQVTRDPFVGRGFEFTWAEYGLGDNVIDPVARLNARIRGGKVNFIVDNATMGGDPAPGELKRLMVRWRANGKEFSSSFTEGTHVALPD